MEHFEITITANVQLEDNKVAALAELITVALEQNTVLENIKITIK